MMIMQRQIMMQRQQNPNLPITFMPALPNLTTNSIQPQSDNNTAINNKLTDLLTSLLSKTAENPVKNVYYKFNI